MNNKDIFSREQIQSWGLIRIIDRELVIDNEIKNLKKPSSELTNVILKQWCERLKINSQEELVKWQINQGLTNTQWQELVTRRFLWTKWCEEKFAEKIDSQYLKRKNQLDNVVYSLLRVKDADLAQELYLRIKESESTFEEISSEYSVGPEKHNGGKIGPVPLNQPHPLLGKLLQISKKNQLWPPKKLENWWIVVRLEEINHAELNNELKRQLSLELGEEYLTQSFLVKN